MRLETLPGVWGVVTWMRPPIDPHVLDALKPPTVDDLRDRAIVAFTDAIERPHAGRVGEALDAVARWLVVARCP